MLDASSTASFLLGPDGEILHANAAARALLTEADGLLEGNGRIQAARPTMKKPLHQLVMGGSSKHALVGASPATRSLALERTSAACPLRLLASPVPNYGPSVPGLEAAEGTLLLVTDPEKPIVLRDDVLRAHYGFTSAETEVANGLLTGFSVDEIAALRRVVPGTVRYQIKSIMAKAGTSRQTDLVRLLMSLPRHP
jgi:DNA-binding CsgD family transcriptional regulator